MNGFFSSSRFAWVLVVVLVLVLLFFALGPTDLGLGRALSAGNPFDYVAASQELAAQDRSQPLHMRLEAQYPGPLQDTTIQRWRDPVDRTVCYVYLPIAVAHMQGPGSLVQYGAANIGSMSCFPAR